MNLRRLELRGFKTFANQTEFVFPSGITALVGPNGSGKSNVADAVRWVLGEQSMRAVRGKRTEDVIFAGAPGRASAGMAEVAITLDNTSGWLPVPFSEVRVSRRAYRSGENEYLLNGAKVRLRDLNDLLLKAGLADSANVVIGQGMVDLALSLRAEERRALIDEAADIKRFYAQLQETRDKIAATEQGLARARDILAEIGPRLAALAEQAARLREHQALSQELQGSLRRWHRHVRGQLIVAARTAEVGLEAAEGETAALRQRIERVARELAAIESEQAREREHDQALAQEGGRLRERSEALRRHSAVLVERRAAQRRLESELTAEWEVIRRAHEAATEERKEQAGRCADLAAAVAAGEAALAEAETRHAARLRQEEESAAQLALLREQTVRLQERATALRVRHEAITVRRDEAAAETTRRQDALSAAGARVAQSTKRIAALQGELERLLAQRATLDEELARLGAGIGAGDESLQPLVAQSRRLARDLDEQRARLEVMERWRDSYSAFSAGVRAVLLAATAQKARAASLSGIVGVTIDLLQAPQDLEAAVEVALGGRAQDIVVERWSDAEAAIAMLKREGAGRATFLPIDTLRVQGRSSNPLAVREPGVRGVAADLVECQQRFKSVVEHLLGRTLVVDELRVARRVLGMCPAGWQLVTVEGELIRTSGAVTGGARKGNEAGLLARQRELRGLRQRVAGLERESAACTARLAAEREAQATRRRELGALEERRRTEDLALRRAEAALAAAKAEARLIGDDQRRAETALNKHEEERRRIEEQAVLLAKEIAKIDGEVAAAQQSRDAFEREERSRRAAQQDVAAALGEQRTALALERRALADCHTALAALDARLRQSSLRLEEKLNRIAAVAAAAAAVEGEAGAADGELAALTGDMAASEHLVAAVRARLRELDVAARILAEDAASTRERLAQSEAARRAAATECSRVQEQTAHARQQAANDLGPAVADELWCAGDIDDEPPGRPEDIKRQLDRARAALRNLGMVNPQAIAEHEETATRHEFLSRQLSDMEEAVRVLRRLSGELQKTMRQRFAETYAAVGTEFRRFFVRLFGGGSARLVLTQPDDIEQTGIEIVAQPPGRRLQSLALLSGGERALTAVALLFAVLTVRPIPFCLLDEVDAALDEANVGRFRDALRDLARRTQFIVITHNRGTMEAADSLYGISMPDDSTSRLVSLRLAGNGLEEEFSHVQPVAAPR